MQIPKNVVQAGDVDPCHKIYIEDYVYTYLSQNRSGDKSADFCLYGKTEKEGEIRYYFIYGAAKEGPGWEMTARRYFSKQIRIGEASVDEQEAWLFFEDGYATPLEGYFIFYEQNEDMQSYLIAVHQNQPGEAVQEVRPRASARNMEAGHRPETKTAEKPEEKDTAVREPRRIRRFPHTYDLEPEKEPENSQEKVMQAAETYGRKRPDKQLENNRRNAVSTSFFSRAAGLAVLLVLCVVGVTSINRYNDMKEAGNMFAGAAQQLEDGGEETASAESGEGNSGFQVEEKQAALPDTENAQAQESLSLPVMSSSVNGTSREDQAAFPAAEDAAEADTLQAQNPVPETQADADGQARADARGDVQEANAQDTPAPSAEGQEASEESDGNVQPASDITSDAVAASAQIPASYTVQSGDSLALICRRFYGNLDKMDEICELNAISNPNRLTPGQKIILPN
nr:LysM domain-containing protein [uncultured Eisenbergiella sp.]